MTGRDVLAVLSALEAAGVGVMLNATGDGLKLTGKGKPPADLLESVRAVKGALLEALTAKERHGQHAPEDLPSSPEAVADGHSLEDAGQVVPARHNPTKPGRLADGRLDVAHLAALPGRCGSCARAVDVSEEWGPLMVACTCDPVAWWPLPAPLALHIGARCGAYQMEGEEVGRGWRAKDTGKRYGPRPPAPSPLPDLGAA